MIKQGFKVVITKRGSEIAKPAIWYAGMAGKGFRVRKSDEYDGVYEVIEGKFKGKVIDIKDCKKQ